MYPIRSVDLTQVEEPDWLPQHPAQGLPNWFSLHNHDIEIAGEVHRQGHQQEAAGLSQPVEENDQPPQWDLDEQ